MVTISYPISTIINIIPIGIFVSSILGIFSSILDLYILIAEEVYKFIEKRIENIYTSLNSL